MTLRAYIGVDGERYRELVPVESIYIARNEGFSAETTVDRWHAASWFLLEQSLTAPKGGGYDKCAFLVKWFDGTEYRGRYDLVHRDNGAWPDLAAHVRGSLEFAAGESAAGIYSDEQQAQARFMLMTVDLQQHALPILPGESFEIVRDYREQKVADAEVTTHERYHWPQEWRRKLGPPITPDRARQLLRELAQWPYWGNPTRFMDADEESAVREYWIATGGGNSSFNSTLAKIAASDQEAA